MDGQCPVHEDRCPVHVQRGFYLVACLLFLEQLVELARKLVHRLIDLCTGLVAQNTTNDVVDFVDGAAHDLTRIQI